MNYSEWHSKQEKARIETEHHEFNVAYIDEGTEEIATLFLHGIPTWSFLYRDVYDDVGRAIIPDLAGYGFTEHIGDGGYERSIREQEDLMIGLLDELELDKVQVVAHDIGGGVALRLAVHTDRVERLVLTNSVCYDSWPTIWESIDENVVGLLEKEWDYDELDRQLDVMIGDRIYDKEKLTDEFVKGIKAPFLERERPLNELECNVLALDTNQTLELVTRHNQIDSPTFLIWGNEDTRQHSGLVDRLENDLPNVQEKKFIDRAHHWVMQDRPDAFSDALSEYLN